MIYERFCKHKTEKKKAKKEGYVSYAQQKAAHASMAERGKKKKNEADDYHYSTGERIKKKPVKKEGMSDAEKAAHQKAIDEFKAKGGKIKKLNTRIYVIKRETEEKLMAIDTFGSSELQKFFTERYNQPEDSIN